MTYDIAWAAGLFEGEGCFSGSGNRRGVVASLTSTDRDVVERFAFIVGVGSIRYCERKRGAPDHWKPQWTWHISGDAAFAVMTMLYPFLCSRRRARVDELRANRNAFVAEATRSRQCEGCGRIFRPRLSPRSRRQAYCTQRCYEAMRAEEKRVDRLPRDCDWCGKPLPPDSWPTKRFCTQSHKSMAYQARRRAAA